jgi:hypothetical protein
VLLLKIPKQQHSEATYINTIKYCFQTFAGSLAGRSRLRCLPQRFGHFGASAHLADYRSTALASCFTERYAAAGINVDILAVLQLSELTLAQ